MKRALNIVLPMAGSGSRFRAAGYEVLKPLIQVDGIPMFKKALSSVFPEIPTRFSFVLPRRDRELLEREIREAYPAAEIFAVPSETRGPAETCLEAVPGLRAEESLLILDCDLWFDSPAFCRLIETAMTGESGLDGGVLTFKSRDPRYSFAEFRAGRVVRTAEKVPISSDAIVGAYFFTESLRFQEALMRSLAGGDNPTFSIAPVYNSLIQDGGVIGAREAERYHSFGTPEELDSYRRESFAIVG